MTSKQEIDEIEKALKVPLRPVQEHLKCSLDRMADRKNPDYRNSMKEAISAVESICKIITKDDKAKFGQALKEIEELLKLHPVLTSAFDKLYGYTSDADGIRHALKDEPNIDIEDARFMLVSCSAFVNYLIGKLNKVGIRL
jgi:hypothetical protein